VLATFLVTFSAYWLMPITGAPGAAILNRCAFERRPAAEFFGRLIASAAFFAFGLKQPDSFGFLFAIGTVFTLLSDTRFLDAALALRARGIGALPTIEQLDDDVGRQLFAAARGVAGRVNAKRTARRMRQIAELLGPRSTVRQSIVIVAVWLGALAAAAVTGAVIAGTPPRPTAPYVSSNGSSTTTRT
jgi:hypothetical protein